MLHLILLSLVSSGAGEGASLDGEGAGALDFFAEEVAGAGAPFAGVGGK